MINLRKANYLYNQRIKEHFKKSRDKKDLLRKKPHILICNYFDRYPNISSIFSLETIFNLGYRKKDLDNNLKYSLEKSQKIAYKLGNLLRGKFIISYLDITSFCLSLLKFFIKFCFVILDLIKTISYSFYYINFIRNDKLLFFNLNTKNKKINLFTINYWKTKQLNSIQYYYPDLTLDEENYFFVTEFFQYRSIYEGLKNFHKNKKIYLLSALDFVSNKDILNVLFLLLETYIFDLLGRHNYSYGIIASNIIKINSINRKFLYLLNFKCGNNIPNKIYFKNIYVWFENQLDSKMFLVGLKSNKIKNKKTNIFSYFGCTSFSYNHHKHLIPNEFELDLGIWGDNKFMMPDQSSIEELKNYLVINFPKYNFKIKKVRKGLRRFKDIKISLDNKFIKKKRKFTFISHGTPKEIFNVFLTLLYSQNNFKEMIINEPIYIRLHPSIDKRNFYSQINLLKKKVSKKIDYPKLIFIEKNQENLIESINQSEYLIFGDSSLINIALLFNSKVISVGTSFLYKSPIQRINQNKNNLFRI